MITSRTPRFGGKERKIERKKERKKE